MKLIHGDCLEKLKELEPNSVDTIITDPPYGILFMGKKWDYEVPKVEVWKECLRVLKPGGTALIFAGSRTQHRMAVNVEDAGFVLKDCIMWIYGSGFPKATDISKQLDKMAGAEREVVGKQSITGQALGKNKGLGKVDNEHKTEWNITAPETDHAKQWNGWKSHGLKPAYEPIIVAMKPNDGTYANNAIKWGVSGLNIDGGRIPTEDNLNGGTYSKGSEKGDDYFKGLENNTERNYTQPQGRYPSNIIHDGSDEVIDLFPETTTGTVKPYEAKDNEMIFKGFPKNKNISRNGDSGSAARYFYSTKESKSDQVQGRFPANIILDEEAGRMLDEQSGELTSGAMKKKYENKLHSTFKGIGNGNTICEKSKGGASRFFYCAKASKSERNKGCEGLEENSWALKNNFSSDPRMNKPQNRIPNQNHHPTVKPLKLMEYLCTITKTPTGGVVLDPYMGSGTTGIASKNTGRDFIGIEMNEEYIKIAEARTNNS